mmetsp:Transcript_26599/g.57882  ORF Transcript_26599/g.57882 Transcript_26599/m.57882 type:complete len:201 (+) Transcript_26599:1288-1890(+)
MQPVAVGVQDEGEGSEEGQERRDHNIEESLGGEHVHELGVANHEANGHGKVDPSLQERNDLGTGAGGSHDEHILGIAEDGVVEEDAEEHESERDNLFVCAVGNTQELAIVRLRDRHGAVGGLHDHGAALGRGRLDGRDRSRELTGIARKEALLETDTLDASALGDHTHRAGPGRLRGRDDARRDRPNGGGTSHSKRCHGV